ncbi:MAG: hypothetical protein M3Z05_20060 [Gemmatimonadota bacterium]|nr:hypothetical protein [Gemmatimonadota bacterium]
MIAASGGNTLASDTTLTGSWTVLYEDLVAGIMHAMNNSVTVLAVSLELSSAGDVPGDVPMLRRELTQLTGLIGFTSALSSRSTRHEALDLSGVLELAVTIHALGPAMRSTVCRVHVTGVVPPVRVSPAVLLRVLLLMIDGAKRARVDGSAAVAIDLSGDTESVAVGAPLRGSVSPDAVVLAASCGGTLVVQEGRAVFTLPSLANLRRASLTGGRTTPKRGAGS